MQLTYWVAKVKNAGSVYDIRKKTKKEVLAEIREEEARGYGSDYGEPTKVTLEYDSAFDLMDSCSDENHHHWEPWE